jgi:hypothetical protein
LPEYGNDSEGRERVSRGGGGSEGRRDIGNGCKSEEGWQQQQSSSSTGINQIAAQPAKWDPALAGTCSSPQRRGVQRAKGLPAGVEAALGQHCGGRGVGGLGDMRRVHEPPTTMPQGPTSTGTNVHLHTCTHAHTRTHRMPKEAAWPTIARTSLALYALSTDKGPCSPPQPKHHHIQGSGTDTDR